MLATEYYAHAPENVTKETFNPTSLLFYSDPALITSPKPSKPPIKGTSVFLYPPLMAARSDGFMVEAMTLIKT